MQIALYQLKPAFDRFEVPIGAVEARIHDRTQMNVQSDVHANADKHRCQRDDFAYCHSKTVLPFPRSPAIGAQGLDRFRPGKTNPFGYE